jgi:hypothetical protein
MPPVLTQEIWNRGALLKVRTGVIARTVRTGGHCSRSCMPMQDLSFDPLKRYDHQDPLKRYDHHDPLKRYDHHDPLKRYDHQTSSKRSGSFGHQLRRTLYRSEYLRPWFATPRQAFDSRRLLQAAAGHHGKPTLRASGFDESQKSVAQQAAGNGPGCDSNCRFLLSDYCRDWRL